MILTSQSKTLFKNHQLKSSLSILKALNRKAWLKSVNIKNFATVNLQVKMQIVPQWMALTKITMEVMHKAASKTLLRSMIRFLTEVIKCWQVRRTVV
jgi:hypothetical protein